MAEPKKRRTPRRQGNTRSHHVLKLARRVNARSPIKVTVGKRAKNAQTAAAHASNSSK